MKDHVLDLKKVLAERAEKQKRELELGGLPSASNDAPLTPLSDSILESSISSSQPIVEKKLQTFVVLKIFESQQTFHLFNEDQVNISWIQKGSKLQDVPKTEKSKAKESHPSVNESSFDLEGYLESEIKTKHLRRSSTLSSRYLFFLMSVTTDTDVIHTCLKSLEEKISDSSEPFCLKVSDLLLVLLNFGTVKSKLWPDDVEISLSSNFQFSSINSFDEKFKNDIPFPRSNLEAVLTILGFNMKTYPNFSESEKYGIFHVMLTLLMANFVAGDQFLVRQIKEIMTRVLESFTDEEWKEFDFKKVEELVLVCSHNELDPVGITQRIKSIPTTTSRGAQLKQSAAFYEAQNLLDFEEVLLCGRVTVDDVYKVVVYLTQMNHKNTDFRRLFCVVKLISWTLDLSDVTDDLDKIDALALAMKQARKIIRDMSNTLDTFRLDVKDLMCEIAFLWKGSIPKNNVV